VNLTVIWRFLLGACELVHILCVRKHVQLLCWKY
jgi:hypothetical protein